MPKGHYQRKDPLDRFMEKVEKTDSCWLWKAHTNSDGYGIFSIASPGGLPNKSVRAHRWVYERLVGPIPDGYQIDHRCRVRNCVNPEHLEAVRPRVNTLRGNTRAADNAQKTHCPQGHPLNENRKCPFCHAAATRRWKEAHTEAIRARRRELAQRPEAKQKARESQKARRAANPEAYRAYMREYYRKRRAKQEATSEEKD